MKLISLLLFVSLAQMYSEPITLSLSSAGGLPNQMVDLPLTLGGAPAAAAVQWTFSYPVADLSSATFAIGPSAIAAGKSLQCGPNNGGSFICIVFGIIQPGVIGTLSATIASSPADQLIPLNLSGLVAADPGANSIPITGTGGSLSLAPEPAWCVPAGLAIIAALFVRRKSATLGRSIED